MTIGVSLILVAVGAILVWGVNAEAEGLDIDAIGVILMIVGFVGALLSMILWSDWSPAYRGRRRVYADEPVAIRRTTAHPRARRTVVEEDEVGGPPAAPPPPP